MKIPFVDYDLYSKVAAVDTLLTTTKNTNIDSTSVIQTTSRASVITTNFIGKTIAVYNGRAATRILITPEMVGYKLGCFVFTKKLGKSIHNSERNRKKIEKMRRKITQKKVRKTVKKAPKAKSSSSKKK